MIKPNATIIIDTDAFGPKDLEKAQFATADYLGELAGTYHHAEEW